MALTLDQKGKSKGNPVRTKAIEQRYGSQLKKVAQQVGAIIQPFTPGDIGQMPTIERLLAAYADMLHGWATQTASNMLMDVALRDEQTWAVLAKDMGRALREEIRYAPTGQVMRALLAEQVGLIQSIPREAARRVHRLTLEGIQNSTRASSIAEEIIASGDVAKSRALLIARTEVTRTATTLTQARATHIGSDGYIWRTAGDGDVRPSHREMNGKFVKWSEPPTLDKLTGHAGCTPNCRCYAEPVIPE
ncbi:phage head morphogenesis protein [Paraburkholderia dioscoreae]|uniref:Phage head morphogenesis protein, SPP1 gp7 n=1 Tax=Paraburkholderia dioscoreae TaxID=2604047 RepID=A0A5Q4ZB14_9BURK|nr:phage minor head protein [Paraburkholderia dioscoreae]VVD29169.1 Phage head morphogenesis protein, SPP1 gp7 [Paraburkholderia dioscoreae]